MQVNGKVRLLLDGLLLGDAGDREKMETLALSNEKIKTWVKDQKYEVIFVPGKVINFVIQV